MQAKNPAFLDFPSYPSLNQPSDRDDCDLFPPKVEGFLRSRQRCDANARKLAILFTPIQSNVSPCGSWCGEFGVGEMPWVFLNFCWNVFPRLLLSHGPCVQKISLLWLKVWQDGAERFSPFPAAFPHPEKPCLV